MSTWLNAIRFFCLIFSCTDDENFIHLGVKLLGLSAQTVEGYKLRLNFRKLISSLVLGSAEKPVHFVFMTDYPSVQMIKVI